MVRPSRPHREAQAGRLHHKKSATGFRRDAVRVLFNGITLLKPKTGIAHAAANLPHFGQLGCERRYTIRD